MDHKEHDALHPERSTTNERNDLVPGREDRNLLSDDRSEAPIDQDAGNTPAIPSDAGDETYADEEEGRGYFERRAGDNVRK